MTPEQYKRAVQISIRMKELNEVKKEIGSTERHRLCYSYYSLNEWRLCVPWVMSQIGEILDKHDTAIRQEIDDEIEKLKAEIETL